LRSMEYPEEQVWRELEHPVVREGIMLQHAVSTHREIEHLVASIAATCVLPVHPFLDQALERLIGTDTRAERIGGADQRRSVDARRGRERVLAVAHPPLVGAEGRPLEHA